MFQYNIQSIHITKMIQDQKTHTISEDSVTKNKNITKKKEQPISIQELKTLKGNLWRARQKLVQFANKIGHLKNTPIREDVIQHCDNINRIKLNLNRLLPFSKLQELIECRIQKMLKNKKVKQNWSEGDILILLWVISKNFEYFQVKNIQTELDLALWEEISSMIPGVEDKDVCRFKWLSLRKNKLTENNWLDIQSIQLDKIVKQSQTEDWQQISQKLYDSLKIPNKTYRCPKQCRQHWNCYLNPNLKKGPWNMEQDLLLLKCIENNNGLRKWTEMVKKFEGRTENALKNRYQLLIKKQKEKNKQINQFSQLQIVKYLKRKYSNQGQFVGKHEILTQYLNTNMKETMKETIKEEKKKKIKKGPKKQRKGQKDQQFQPYIPPRKRKQIKKQNRFNAKTNYYYKKIRAHGSQMEDLQMEQEGYSQNLMEIQQFQITQEKQGRLAEVKGDINQSGPFFQFSQISPFKPYCYGYSSKNISNQLLFLEEQIDEQEQQQIKREKRDQKIQKMLQLQNKRQSCGFNQFYVKQMDHDMLKLIISCNKQSHKKNEGCDINSSIINQNKSQSTIINKETDNISRVVIKDIKTLFLPCMLDNKKQKLIPFSYELKNEPN